MPPRHTGKHFGCFRVGLSLLLPYVNDLIFVNRIFARVAGNDYFCMVDYEVKPKTYKHTMNLKKLSLISILLALTASAKASDYNILKFGAVADTTQLSTKAIQKAIDTAARQGGGRVVVPAGSYKTGTLVLRSGVDLHLDSLATLYGSTDLSDYAPQRTDYVSLRTHGTTIQLIYADQCDNVKISGRGTIDGRGRGFKKLTWNDEGITRPHLLRMVRCKGVEVSGITLRNAGCWMQHYLACDNVKLHDLTIENRNNYNNDAIDIDGCHDVVIERIKADSDDDGITLKSTSPRLCENVSISNCIVSSHCNAVKLGTETNGGFRNISIRNIIIHPSKNQTSKYFGRWHGISSIALEIVDGGVMDNVRISNVNATGTEVPVFIRLGNRARPYADDVPVKNVGSLGNVVLENISVITDGTYGSSITGMEGHKVSDITLRNVYIRHRGGEPATEKPKDEMLREYPEATQWGPTPAKGFWMNHATGVTFDNVVVETELPDARPLYVADDADNITVK